MSTIGNYLQKIREEQDISIRHLSRISGVSHSEINKIENGERAVPSAMHLKLIASALGINQIECLRIAGYIDENVHELNAEQFIDLTDFTAEEVQQIRNFANFIKIATVVRCSFAS